MSEQEPTSTSVATSVTGTVVLTGSAGGDGLVIIDSITAIYTSGAAGDPADVTVTDSLGAIIFYNATSEPATGTYTYHFDLNEGLSGWDMSAGRSSFGHNGTVTVTATVSQVGADRLTVTYHYEYPSERRQ